VRMEVKTQSFIIPRQADKCQDLISCGFAQSLPKREHPSAPTALGSLRNRVYGQRP
jgi:hypothetical protein